MICFVITPVTLPCITLLRNWNALKFEQSTRRETRPHVHIQSSASALDTHTRKKKWLRLKSPLGRNGFRLRQINQTTAQRRRHGAPTWAVMSAAFLDMPYRSWRYADTGAGRLKDAATVEASRTVKRRYVGIGTGLGLAVPNMRVNARSCMVLHGIADETERRLVRSGMCELAAITHAVHEATKPFISRFLQCRGEAEQYDGDIKKQRVACMHACVRACLCETKKEKYGVRHEKLSRTICKQR